MRILAKTPLVIQNRVILRSGETASEAQIGDRIVRALIDSRQAVAIETEPIIPAENTAKTPENRKARAPLRRV